MPVSVLTRLCLSAISTYLGAELTVADRRRPLLRAPAVDLEHEFSALPAFQHEAADLLRRTFFLDMLTRFLDQTEEDWFHGDALSVLELDPSWCMEATIAERLRAYLDADFERVSALFPPWLSTVVVEPSYDHARALPFLVADLSQPLLTSGGAGESSESVATTAAPHFAEDPQEPTAAAAVASGSPSTTDPFDAFDGPYLGWLGEEPIDRAYRTTTAAYRNRARYLDVPDELAVAVVCTDPDRRAVRDRAVEWYAVDEPVPATVDVVDEPTCAELGDLLASGVDFLHVVGDCDDGIACADGICRPTAVDVNVRSFFLDGDDSVDAGLAMLEAGAVAGGVWDGPADAATGRDGVRGIFARTLVGGFTIDLARRTARRFGGEKPLCVVGDGLTELAPVDQRGVFPMEVEPLGAGRFRVRIPVRHARPGIGFGGLCLEHWQLGGSEFELTLDADEVAQLLDARWYVLIVDGIVYRVDEVGPFAPLV